MIKKKTSSIRGLANNRNEQLRFYRWINHEIITKDNLINSSLSKTAPEVSQRHVLAIQDTTEINYEAHADRVSGLGTVGNGSDAGLFLHPLLVIDAKTHQSLGFGAIYQWQRMKGKKPNYRQLPIEEKESYRWLETAMEGKKTLKDASCITFIGERENDIYEFLDRIPDEKYHVLLRSRGQRVLLEGGLLHEHIASQPIKAVTSLDLPGTHKRQACHLELALRFCQVRIKRPKNCPTQGTCLIPYQLSMPLRGIRCDSR